MSWLFSKRCRQGLNNKEIEVHIPLNVRVRIWKLFEKYDQLFEETRKRKERRKKGVRSQHLT